MNVAPRGSWRPPARQHALRRKVAAACLVAIAVIVAIAATSGSTSLHVRIPTGPPPSALAPPSPQELVDDSHRREDAAIDRVLSYTPFVLRGGSQQREIALTFDDGPGPYSLALLSVLKRLRVPATYFEVGSQERYFSSATQAQIAAGYFVEDHTETHPELAALSPTDQQNEIFEQPATITPYGAPYPRLFRPPYGSFNSTTLSLLREAHMLMVLWTVDTDDYLLPGVRRDRPLGTRRRRAGRDHPDARRWRDPHADDRRAAADCRRAARPRLRARQRPAAAARRPAAAGAEAADGTVGELSAGSATPPSAPPPAHCRPPPRAPRSRAR